jgi:hypothetical protein
LRRTTCGARSPKLVRSGQAPLEQIRLAHGHQSIQTTQRYLGSELDPATCLQWGLERDGDGRIRPVRIDLLGPASGRRAHRQSATVHWNNVHPTALSLPETSSAR